MPYFIEVRDKPEAKQIREQRLTQHLEYLDANAHKLLAAGGLLDDTGKVAHGGFYIIDVEEREEAEAFVADDPFVTGGLFEIVQITRWRKAYFDRQRLI